MNSVGKEFIQIMKEHKLLVAVIAVIVVPILYAGMFLWAFWDPYDHLEDVPVAVVNDDAGYVYEGERLDLGEELVDNLEEEADFDFHFVDAETAEKGLDNEDYYMAVKIPPAFSEYATTVMDEVPKQLELIYTPNEGYNFLAGQIGETAMLKIEQALEEKITETYAETLFENIEDVADGLVDASEATASLHDGAGDLQDGSTELKDNMVTLASKTLTFKDGLATAADGSTALTDGITTLSDGLSALELNSLQLQDASWELADGAGELQEGVTEAKNGLGAMNEQMPSLVDGTTQVQSGLGQLQQQLPKQMAGALTKQIDAAGDSILTGTTELKQGIVDGLENELSPQLSQGLATGLAAQLSSNVADEVKQMTTAIPQNASDDIAKEITKQLKTEQANQQEELIAALHNAGIPEETIQDISRQLGGSGDGGSLEQHISGQLENAFAGIAMNDTQQQAFQSQLEKQINASITDGVADAIAATTNNVNDGFDTYEKAIQDGLGKTANGVEDQIKQAIDQPIGSLQTGLEEIQDGQTELAGGVSQLANGATALQDGAQSLHLAEQEYAGNMQTFSSSMTEANNGAGELFSGAVKLEDGVLQLKDGSSQLSNGSQQLADGSVTLNDGLMTLNDATGEFNDEMNDAAADAGDVKNNEATNKMMANPVKVKDEKVNEVPNYGTGFAPYFLSLGLFVGALLLSIVYPLREPAGRPTSAVNWFLSKLSVLVAVGVLQAIIASVFLLTVLGLEVKSVPLFIMFAIITSLVFITLIQFLVTCLGDPGRFIAIIILIMQLTTSAGTFPLEVIPKVLQPFNALLPMTYTVHGLKAVISTGEYSVMWQNAGILGIFAVVCMILTLTYFFVLHKRKFAHSEEEAA